MSKNKIKPNPKRKTITIFTKNWTRGGWCNEYGHCCALGFAGKQLYGSARYFSGNIFASPEIESYIFAANDNLRGKERRKELRRLFKEAGYRLVFKE